MDIFDIVGKGKQLDDRKIGFVNDIETLGTNLSRKIWQKIMILDRAAPGE